MSKFALLLLFVSGFALADEQSPLNCDTPPGRRICYTLDSAISSYNWRCTGYACYDVWRNQHRAVRNVTDEILASPAPSEVTVELGEKAYRLAHRICSTSRRFSRSDYRIIIPLINAENGLLNLLLELQEKAALERVRYCQLTVN